jgi:ribosomal protein S27AE
MRQERRKPKRNEQNFDVLMAGEKKEKKVAAYKPGKQCPKCGSRLADHKNRRSCGKCGYTEFKPHNGEG